MKKAFFVSLCFAGLAVCAGLLFPKVLAYAGGNVRSAALSGSTTIVISQVYGGGGSNTGTPTYTKDYVELKNISNTPQSLNGLSLYYGSATGQFASSASNAFALANVTLQPGQYYLVALSSAGTAGVAIPVTPDESTTNLSMSATNGKVALVNGLTPNTCGASATPCTLPNAQIIDLVSWGTANNAEGGTAVNNGTSLTNTDGSVRKDNGCTDTDNNNADFTVVSGPVPHNSATALAPCGTVAPHDANVDMNGDGKTDYVVVRRTGTAVAGDAKDTSGMIPSVRQRTRLRAASKQATTSPSNTPAYWYTLFNGTTNYNSVQWGDAEQDTYITGDFDGDTKDDVAVWRPGDPVSTFYILNSFDSTFSIVELGDQFSDPSVTGDYDADGKADPAVFTCPIGTAGNCFYSYVGSKENPSKGVTIVQWGVGDGTPAGNPSPAPGDYDGDGKYDFCVQVQAPGGNPGDAWFVILRTSDEIAEQIQWGITSDTIEPGDYDGDGKTDITVVRNVSGTLRHFILLRTGSALVADWGTTGDTPVPGDYDGDGRTDVAVFRPVTPPGGTTFFSLNVQNGSYGIVQWGACLSGFPCDQPLANWNVQ